MGNEWIEKHIKTVKKSNLVYSYNGRIKIERLKKQFDEEKDQVGGDSEDIPFSADEDEELDSNENEEQEPEQEQIEPELEEFDAENIEEMHLINEDIDNEAEKTKKQLDNILEEEANIAKTRKERNIEFSTDNMKNNYSAEISDIVEKKYIFSQFIYSDDTILTMKKKICIAIEKNKEFESSMPYFIPARIYTWAEYTFNHFDGKKYIETNDSLMLGRNWLKQNNILQIETIPLENFHDYEILKGHLGVIKEGMGRYGSRIHTEDTNHMILQDYNDYLSSNEIFFTDIYTELGLHYNPSKEIINNVKDLFVKIYFTESEYDLPQILEYLNDNKDAELKKIRQIITTIDNDLSLENHVMHYVEEEYDNSKDYEHYFKDNFITQTTTHVSLYITNINGKDINIEKDITTTSLLKFNLHFICPKLRIHRDLQRIFIQFTYN
jgi:hypothetical protein